MVRMVLTDEQWSRMECYCLGKRGDPGRSGVDNRLFMEVVLWKDRTGGAWRGLPEIFDKWNTVFKRFNDWSAKGVFKRMFETVSDDPDMEYAMMDAMIVPVYRYGHGAKGMFKIKLLADQKANEQETSSP